MVDVLCTIQKQSLKQTKRSLAPVVAAMLGGHRMGLVVEPHAASVETKEWAGAFHDRHPDVSRCRRDDLYTLVKSLEDRRCRLS
jgi:hypothetical protein